MTPKKVCAILGGMNKKYEIQTTSAVHLGNCVLGRGNTEKEAWEDAYGPKPWSSYVKKSARKAWVVTCEEAAE